jgi:flavin reductase (DIM6/NTAB) family NADH-FMN oxidoreductase RutF
MPGYSTELHGSLAIGEAAVPGAAEEPGSMAVEAAEFRRILGHWATGVAIVTSVTDRGEPRGLTANAVASVSLEPPLMLVCVERSADTHASIRSAGFFAVNILPQSAETVARRFAGDDTAAKFAGVAYHTRATGAPILDAALAWVDCQLHAEHRAGDHSIFVGAVVAGDAAEGEPLVFYRSGYGRLVP